LWYIALVISSGVVSQEREGKEGKEGRAGSEGRDREERDDVRLNQYQMDHPRLCPRAESTACPHIHLSGEGSDEIATTEWHSVVGLLTMGEGWR
jgi:hypothetical protein